jgi:hypothetical protein
LVQATAEDLKRFVVETKGRHDARG